MLVHRLEQDPLFVVTAASDERTILNAQSAAIAQGGSKNSYSTAGNSGVQLISMDKREDQVVINTPTCPTGANALNVGDKGALTCVLKALADGIGSTGNALTKTWTYAVVESLSLGPVIEGVPSYNITFACQPITNA